MIHMPDMVAAHALPLHSSLELEEIVPLRALARGGALDVLYVLCPRHAAGFCLVPHVVRRGAGVDAAPLVLYEEVGQQE